MKINYSLYRQKWFLGLTVILLFLCSGSALQTIYPFIQYLPAIFLVLMVIPIVNEIVQKRLNLYNCAPILMAIMIILAAICECGDNILNYFLLSCTILIAFSITLIFSFENFINIFLKMMTVITVIAIVCYCLVNYSSVLSSLPRIKNINGVEYATMLIYNYITIVPERNCAIFWEPGLFATFLSFSMVFEILLKKSKISLARIVIFSIGIITATSSAGFILWTLCIVLLLTKGVTTNKNITLKTAIMFLLFLVGIGLILNFDSIILNTSLKDNEYVVKLLSKNLMSSTRWMAVKHNLEVFATEPILGVGISNATAQMKYVTDTSTSTYLLSVFGILGLLYTIFIVYGVLKLKGINIYSKVLLLAILLLIVNKEPHIFIMFTWCFIFYLLKLSKAPNLINNQQFLCKYQ